MTSSELWRTFFALMFGINGVYYLCFSHWWSALGVVVCLVAYAFSAGSAIKGEA